MFYISLIKRAVAMTAVGGTAFAGIKAKQLLENNNREADEAAWEKQRDDFVQLRHTLCTIQNSKPCDAAMERAFERRIVAIEAALEPPEVPAGKKNDGGESLHSNDVLVKSYKKNACKLMFSMNERSNSSRTECGPQELQLFNAIMKQFIHSEADIVDTFRRCSSTARKNPKI